MGKKQAASKQAKPAKSSTQAHKKSKKQHGSFDYLRDPLDRELALIGLRVKNITADGNCFFRALSDQLQGDECSHSSLRSRVVALMRERQEEFEPFVEDDQGFDTYTARMSKEGVWAGHMELHAASLLLGVNIAVYQAGQPRWAITNFPPDSRQLHLSYHDGQHYNSVRRVDDYSSGAPPADIQEGALAAVAHADQLQQCWSAADEALVAAGTGCANPVLIQQQLAAAKGDVDVAIEAVIEILAAEDDAGAAAAGDDGGVAERHEDDTGAADAAAAAAGDDSGGGGGVSGSGVQQGSGTEQQQPQVHMFSDATDSNAVGVGAAEAAAAAVTAAAAIAAVTAAAAESGSITSSDQPTQATSNEGGERCSGSNASNTSVAAAAGAAAGDSIPIHANSSSRSSSCATTTRGQHVKHKEVKAKGNKQLKQAAGKASFSAGHDGAGAAGAGAAAGGGGGDSRQRASRNKPCPCGSGRKHKNCCALRSSSAAGGSSKVAQQQEGSSGDAVGSLPIQLATLHI